MNPELVSDGPLRPCSTNSLSARSRSSMTTRTLVRKPDGRELLRQPLNQLRRPRPWVMRVEPLGQFPCV